LPREKLIQLVRITISLPPYSPDLALTEYHFFRSLSKYLCGQEFDEEKDVKVDTATFFAQRSVDFHERGILSLLDRWRGVIDTNGAFTVDGWSSWKRKKKKKMSKKRKNFLNNLILLKRNY
jgi:histone-lysine N-methyltransferase SETMAR